MGIKLNIKDIDPIENEPVELDPQEKVEMQEAAEYFRASAAAHQQNAKEMRKVFITTGIIVLALAVIAFAILGWFANNKSASGQGMTVNAKKQTISISDYFVYYTDKSSGTTEYLSKELGTGEIRMPDYDAAIYENNDTAAYFKIPITSNNEFGPDTHRLSITVSRDPNAVWKTVDQDDDFYMSTILQVKAGTVPALQGTTDDIAISNQDIYTKAHAALLTETAKTFVQDKSNPGANPLYDAISFEVGNGYKVYTVTGEGGATEYKTYIYIEMDYCKELINKMYKINGTGDIGAGTYKTQFLHDTSKLSVAIIKR